MRSMTGFGRGRSGPYLVEIRSVNHRHLDLKIRGGLEPSLEAQVQAKVRAGIERGALQVSVDRATGTSSRSRIDQEQATLAHHELWQLANRLSLPPPDLRLILAQPGVVVPGEPVAAHDPVEVLTAVSAALGDLTAMRNSEGQALAADLTVRFVGLGELVARITASANGVPGLLRERLLARIRHASDGAIELQPARLEQEVALLADRADITEELVRLRSHLAQAAVLISSDDGTTIGRPLDFLIQEIARELGTIGAKAPTAEIVAMVISGKATLEKAREQAQNVE